MTEKGKWDWAQDQLNLIYYIDCEFLRFPPNYTADNHKLNGGDN